VAVAPSRTATATEAPLFESAMVGSFRPAFGALVAHRRLRGAPGGTASTELDNSAAFFRKAKDAPAALSDK
jgi:hypothetical protein